MPSLTLPMNLPGKSITKSRILLAKIFEGLWDIHLKKKHVEKHSRCDKIWQFIAL